VTDDEHREHAKKIAAQINEELKLATPIEPLIAIKEDTDMQWRVERC
jgi:hypothetical protein